MVVFLVDVAGFVDVNCSVVIGSFVVVVVSVTYGVGSSSVVVECSVDNGGFVVIFSVDVISFVDINCSVGSSWSVDIISSVDDDCSVDFCNFVVDQSISSVNVVISSVVNFSIVIGKTVVDLIVLSADVIGIAFVISVVDISSVDDVVVSANVVILSVNVDDDDGETVLCDIGVASSVVMNSKVVSGGIVVDSSVVFTVPNSTVVSGTVFVVSVVHNE